MKTAHKTRQHGRDARIAAKMQTLMARPGAMKTACEQVVMSQFAIKSRATVWRICRRVAARNTINTTDTAPANRPNSTDR